MPHAALKAIVALTLLANLPGCSQKAADTIYPDAFVATSYAMPAGYETATFGDPALGNLTAFLGMASNPGYARDADAARRYGSETLYVGMAWKAADHHAIVLSLAVKLGTDADAERIESSGACPVTIGHAVRSGRILSFVTPADGATGVDDAALAAMSESIRAATAGHLLC
ncbi:MAG: hypothetical protein V4510_10715 [bacterium]